jgi:hypothetical protein
MNKMEELIKEAYGRLRDEKLPKVSPPRLSEEDMACYVSGLTDEREKQKILDSLVNSQDEEALRRSFLLAAEMPTEEEVPGALAEKVKQYVTESAQENVLDAAVEFAENIVRVIRTTGTILSCPAPAVAYRDIEALAESRTVEISKAVNGYVIDIKVTRIKSDAANLTVRIKNRKTGKPSSGERVSLVYENRELRSSLTDVGKVEFENIKLRDYQVNLVRKGESRCIAILSLKVLEN